MISGSSTTLQTNTTVTILIQNSLGEKSVNIEFSIVSYDTTCTSSEVLVTIARTTKSNSHQESFTIYRGENSNGTLVFTQPFIGPSFTFTWKLCLSKAVHTIILTDSNSNGWSSGSNVIL